MTSLNDSYRELKWLNDERANLKRAAFMGCDHVRTQKKHRSHTHEEIYEFFCCFGMTNGFAVGMQHKTRIFTRMMLIVWHLAPFLFSKHPSWNEDGRALARDKRLPTWNLSIDSLRWLNQTRISNNCAVTIQILLSAFLISCWNFTFICMSTLHQHFTTKSFGGAINHNCIASNNKMKNEKLILCNGKRVSKPLLITWKVKMKQQNGLQTINYHVQISLFMNWNWIYAMLSFV